jgi:hypothetical protein
VPSLQIGTENRTASVKFSGVNRTPTVNGTVNVGGPLNANQSGIITFTTSSILVATLVNLNQNSASSLSITSGRL